MGAEWFCIVLEPGCNRQVESRLAALGYRVFFPKVRRWVSHARVRRVAEKPLLGRYVFVEVDSETQSWASVFDLSGVLEVISVCGAPWPMPRREVEGLLHRYLDGEFDEVKNGPLPIGARVKIMEGHFANWLATVTGRARGGLTLKLLGRREHINRVSSRSVRPAMGFDLKRGNPK